MAKKGAAKKFRFVKAKQNDVTNIRGLIGKLRAQEEIQRISKQLNVANEDRAEEEKKEREKNRELKAARQYLSQDFLTTQGYDLSQYEKINELRMKNPKVFSEIMQNSITRKMVENLEKLKKEEEKKEKDEIEKFGKEIEMQEQSTIRYIEEYRLKLQLLREELNSTKGYDRQPIIKKISELEKAIKQAAEFLAEPAPEPEPDKKPHKGPAKPAASAALPKPTSAASPEPAAPSPPVWSYEDIKQLPQPDDEDDKKILTSAAMTQFKNLEKTTEEKNTAKGANEAIQRYRKMGYRVSVIAKQPDVYPIIGLIRKSFPDWLNQRITSGHISDILREKYGIELGLRNIWGLGLKKWGMNNLNDIAKRMKILMGAYMSGNKSDKIVEELYEIFDYLLRQKEITKKQHAKLVSSLQMTGSGIDMKAISGAIDTGKRVVEGLTPWVKGIVKEFWQTPEEMMEAKREKELKNAKNTRDTNITMENTTIHDLDKEMEEYKKLYGNGVRKYRKRNYKK